MLPSLVPAGFLEIDTGIAKDSPRVGGTVRVRALIFGLGADYTDDISLIAEQYLP